MLYARDHCKLENFEVLHLGERRGGEGGLVVRWLVFGGEGRRRVAAAPSTFRMVSSASKLTFFKMSSSMILCSFSRSSIPYLSSENAAKREGGLMTSPPKSTPH
jgi:hypothetical protein